MGKSGSAPKAPQPSPYEVAIEKAMADFYTQTMPGQTEAAKYQMAIETGRGFPAPLGMGGAGAVPAAAGAPGGALGLGQRASLQEVGGGKYPSWMGWDTGSAKSGTTPAMAMGDVSGYVRSAPGEYYKIGGAQGLAAPAGAPGVPGAAGAPGVPAPAGAPGAGAGWQEQIAGRGGLMGLRAQYGAGLGKPGEIGTTYGTGIETQEALGQTQQYLQNRGLMPKGGGSGLMLELGTRRAAEIAERAEQRRRQEQMTMLGTGGG